MSRHSESLPPRQGSGRPPFQRLMSHPAAGFQWEKQEQQKVGRGGTAPGWGITEGTVRVSDTLRPRFVNDAGLQRTLQRLKSKKHSDRFGNNARDVKREGTGSFGQRHEASSAVRQWQQMNGIGQNNKNDGDDDVYINNNNSNKHYNSNFYKFLSSGDGVSHNNSEGHYYYHYYGDHHKHRAMGQDEEQTFSKEDVKMSHPPKVDVVAAFSRMSGGGGGGDSARNNIKKSFAHNSSTSPPQQSTLDVIKTHEKGESKYEKNIEVDTNFPHGSCNKQTCLENKNASVVANDKSCSMHSNVEFSTIQRSVSGTCIDDKNQNLNAVAERILYALLQQNEELAAVANIQSGELLAKEAGNSVGIQENREDCFPASFIKQGPIALRISPDESRFLLGFVNKKDQEILRLRCSLALSYRCAAHAIYRQYQQNTHGSFSPSLSKTELRFLEAVASTIKNINSEKETPLLINRAPPHVQGIPNVPLPLCLSESVCQICGMLSLLNVEDMLQKKSGLRIFSRPWHSYFVVADDRGLTVFRSEEDYKEHAFQRTLLKVSFKDMEYFVPSFRNLSIGDDGLLSDTNSAIYAGDAEQRECSRASLFSSLIGKAKTHKKGKDKKAKAGADDTSERVSVLSESVYSLNDDKKLSQQSKRRRFNRYDELMARVAREYAGDVLHAYFGFIPKQPSTACGGKIVNPPIIFRTKSAQEHVEWVHYFAQCFNKKLYREMFPLALAETYVEKESRETQTTLDIIEKNTIRNFFKQMGEKEEEKVVPPFTDNKTQTEVSCVDAATQTTLPWQQSAFILGTTENVEKGKKPTGEQILPTAAEPPQQQEKEKEEQPTLHQPRPPLSTPPKHCVIWSEKESANGSRVEELQQFGTEATVEKKLAEGEKPRKNEDCVCSEVPWKELVTELRGLLATKNAEREELQRECRELRHRVQQLLRSPQQFSIERDDHLDESKKTCADCDVASKRLLEMEHELHATKEEVARVAEEATKKQEGLIEKLREELTHMQQERDLVVAELQSVKEGCSDGIRSLAKKALGDIDQLHNAYSAQEYVCALREQTTCTSDEETPSLKQQPPRAPPPATSLRQLQPLPPCQNTNNTAEPVNIAMLLISFAPQHMAIDGCFTVDESQARLLRGGPLRTQQGRQWVIFHHDTGAVFVVTAELRTKTDALRLVKSGEQKSAKSRCATELKVTRRRPLPRRNSSVAAVSPVSSGRGRGNHEDLFFFGAGGAKTRNSKVT